MSSDTEYTEEEVKIFKCVERGQDFVNTRYELRIGDRFIGESDSLALLVYGIDKGYFHDTDEQKSSNQWD